MVHMIEEYSERRTQLELRLATAEPPCSCDMSDIPGRNCGLMIVLSLR
jgi:hypothetical protein